MGPSDPALGNVGLRGIGDSTADVPGAPRTRLRRIVPPPAAFPLRAKGPQPVGPPRLQGQELIEVAPGAGDCLSDGDIPIFLAGSL